MKPSTTRKTALLVLALALSGCAQLRGRNHAREGNRLFLEGNYSRAAKEYAVAEQMLPTLSVITLNRGLACRQLMVPGAKTPENEEAVRCALDSFSRFRKARPQDSRGEQLYLQTLFDADRFEDLIAHYEGVLQKDPQSLEAINALTQIYSRTDRWDKALQYTQRRCEIAANDAEVEYSAGVFIWNRLYQKGGFGEKASFNPRSEPKQNPPPFAEGDIVGEERVRLSDLGISYLEKALAIRPTYREAMIYLNLLYRQKSFAYFEDADKWQAALEQALAWHKKAQDMGGPPPPTGGAQDQAQAQAPEQAQEQETTSDGAQE